jgi:hypothetical protein
MRVISPQIPANHLNGMEYDKQESENSKVYGGQEVAKVFYNYCFHLIFLRIDSMNCIAVFVTSLDYGFRSNHSPGSVAHCLSGFRSDDRAMKVHNASNGRHCPRTAF